MNQNDEAELLGICIFLSPMNEAEYTTARLIDAVFMRNLAPHTTEY